MNELKKIIIISSIFFLLGLCVAGTICWRIAQRRINQADRTAERLADDLARTSEQLASAELIIGNCRAELVDLSAELGNCTNGLEAIIQSLERTRDKVKEMETLLYNYNRNISSHN